MKKNIRKSLLGKRDLSTGRVSVGSALGRILLHRKDDSNKIVSAIRTAAKNGVSEAIVLEHPITKKELKASN